MRALGAEVVIVEQASGSTPGRVSGADLALVEARTAEIVAERAAFRADQFVREGSVLAHERHTGPELWEQSGGRVDIYVDLVGTGGSFTGVTRALSQRNLALRAYAVEPAGSAVLAGQPVTDPRHRLQGAGYARAELPLFDRGLATGFVQVTDTEAVEAARFLAAEEGIFAGGAPGRRLGAACRVRGGVDGGLPRLRQQTEVPEHRPVPLTRSSRADDGPDLPHTVADEARVRTSGRSHGARSVRQRASHPLRVP